MLRCVYVATPAGAATLQKYKKFARVALTNTRQQTRRGEVQQISRIYRVHLEEFDGEEVFAGSTVHQVLKHRAHYGFIRELAPLRQGHVNKDRSGLHNIKDAIPVAQVKSITAFAEVHFRRK